MSRRARTGTVDFITKRRSTPDEASNLAAVFLEEGDDKALSALPAHPHLHPAGMGHLRREGDRAVGRRPEERGGHRPPCEYVGGQQPRALDRLPLLARTAGRPHSEDLERSGR